MSLIITEVDNQQSEAPKEMRLDQNFPNPFNPATVITYALPSDGLVDLKIFSLLGEEVASIVSEKENAGIHSLTWNVAQQPSGIYISQLTFQASDKSYSRQARKMVYIR